MSTIRTHSLGRAFADPVHQSQASFRAILAAMSEPGTVHQLVAQVEPPLDLDRATAICLLTLADHDTNLWLSPHIGPDVTAFLRFHCGAPVTAIAKEADFAVLTTQDEIDLAAFNAGDDRYPDRAATIILQCNSLRGGTPASLSGPGIQGARIIAPAGLSDDFWQQAAANHACYPLGVDLVLVGGIEVMAIPRSTSITISGELH